MLLFDGCTSTDVLLRLLVFIGNLRAWRPSAQVAEALRRRPDSLYCVLLDGRSQIHSRLSQLLSHPDGEVRAQVVRLLAWTLLWTSPPTLSNIPCLWSSLIWPVHIEIQPFVFSGIGSNDGCKYLLVVGKEILQCFFFKTQTHKGSSRFTWIVVGSSILMGFYVSLNLLLSSTKNC